MSDHRRKNRHTVDDDLQDGPQDYFVILDKAESNDRFYNGFDSQYVYVRNDDDELLPSLSI